MNLAKTIVIVAGLAVIILAVYLWHPSESKLPWRANVTIQGENFTVEVVSADKDKQIGLSGRDYLPLSHGMLFLYDNKDKRSFWMKDMKFDIDLLWIADDKIVGIEENIPAPTLEMTDTDKLPIYSSPQAVDKVLEFSAGIVSHHLIKVGDTINFDIYDRK